jgi:hypothetical protein
MLAMGSVLAALIIGAAGIASAGSARIVPCSGPGGGAAGLAAAITAANSSGGATINLAPGCTYHLTTASTSNAMFGDTGLPVISSRITLNGFHTTIAGNHSTFRILLVMGPAGKLTLQGLTITGGSTPGPGGGILNLEGALVLNHSRVTGNASAGGGGGIASGTAGTVPAGTAVLNFSRVDHNTTSANGGGIVNRGGTLIVNASSVDRNTSAEGGGGIVSGTGMGGVGGGGILVLKFSRVTRNTADTSSPGGPMAGAGGIANGGAATIKGSVIDGNTAPGGAGGGILNHATMTISGSRVDYNTVPTDSAGHPGNGAGIANLNFAVLVPGAASGGFLTIAFSQVSHNTASGKGGGILEATVDAHGGFTLPGNQLTLKFSLVKGNRAAQGGGIYAVKGSPVTLKFTLVIKNHPDNCFPPGSIRGCRH